MSEKIDNILQQMKELTDAVKEAKAPKVDLNWDMVEETFGEQVKELVAAQVEEKLASQPQRRVPGEAVGYGDVPTVSKANRYYRYVKEFEKNGFMRIGNQRVKGIDLFLAHTMLRKAHSLMPDRVTPPSEELAEAVKALSATGAGTGAELVPTGMASELWDDIFLASRVVSSITTVEMPTNPFDIPLGLGDVTWYKGTDNTAVTGSDPTTAKSTLTATELAAEVDWSYTLNEDAVIALMPAVRARLAISGAEIVDAFALNADSTVSLNGNINLNDGTPGGNEYYVTEGQDGIRHLFLVDNTAQGVDAAGALTDSSIVSALSKMGKYAVNPDQVAMFCDASTYLNGFLSLTNVTTVDKFGPDATVLTGQLAAYRGVPVVVSASMGLTTADGKISGTASNNTKGQVAIVNRTMWYGGFLRQLLIEVDRDIKKRQWIMVASLREAVAAHGTRSSATHTAGIYNITV